MNDGINQYITASVIKTLREQKQYTQKQLAGLLQVSDKTVSKWETGKGFPDISLIEPLAKALSVSVIELLSGEYVTNRNKTAKMTRTKFYICPICGNIIHSTGEGTFSCCGILLPPQECEEEDGLHIIRAEEIDGEYHIELDHEMTKEHSISFIAYMTVDRMEMKKLYPEQSPQASFRKRGHGDIYVYCNHHGLFRVRI